MISAKLLIEFNKPQKQDNTAVRKAYSALLKPVSDLDNFVITTRDKKQMINGKDLLLSKICEIDTSDSGMLNEVNISQEMTKFILEIENEKKATD